VSTIERLHYANGRRLDAGDLRLEQHYHIAMRRLLNSGLFTPGVVNGLEVEKATAPDGSPDPRKVVVKAGLALDPLGRELVVPTQATVAVPNQRPVNRARPGYFLVIRYHEVPMPGAAHPCAADGAAPEPDRIVESPRLEWTEDWPDHSGCKLAPDSLDCAIVLALVVLDSGCQVTGIETGAGLREYAYPVHLSQVQALALEGEKDLDKDNAKLLHFHVRGGSPSSVVLYLWGAQFSSLFYTELGGHTHGVGGYKLTNAQTNLAAHTHDLGNHTHALPNTSSAGDHNHALRRKRTELPPQSNRIATETSAVGGNIGYVYASPPYVQVEGAHSHAFPGPTAGPVPNQTGAFNAQNPAQVHSHDLQGASASTGANVAARAGNGHAWLDDMRVVLDGTDVTDKIVKRYFPAWKKLGDGAKGHPFNDPAGTGPVSLLDLGVDIGHGAHTLTFAVAGGGGRVLYNLYVA
jgi:hypothetical protein